jgi:hypothetical protein
MGRAVVREPQVFVTDEPLSNYPAHLRGPGGRRGDPQRGHGGCQARPRSRVRAGDQVEVVVDTERMHFFDPETGNTIRD